MQLLPPKPWHRTISLDYAAVLKGPITCQLDNQKRVTLDTGDVLVQRGTIHAWINHTKEWTRMLFVVEGAYDTVSFHGLRHSEASF